MVFALLCSVIAYRAFEAPRLEGGLAVLHWRLLAKGLAGGCAFLVAMALGGTVVSALG